VASEGGIKWALDFAASAAGVWTAFGLPAATAIYSAMKGLPAVECLLYGSASLLFLTTVLYLAKRHVDRSWRALRVSLVNSPPTCYWSVEQSDEGPVTTITGTIILASVSDHATVTMTGIRFKKGMMYGVYGSWLNGWSGVDRGREAQHSFEVKFKGVLAPAGRGFWGNLILEDSLGSKYTLKPFFYFKNWTTN
jgi:hypothetical protein